MPPRNTSSRESSHMAGQAYSTERKMHESFGDFSDIPVADILDALGFRKIQYSQIPEPIRDNIHDALMHKDFDGLHGMPPFRMFAGISDWPENFQISASDDYSIIYFYFDIQSGGKRHINMTQLKNTDGGYRVIPMIKGADIDECVRSLILYNERIIRLALQSRERVEKV